MTRFLVYSRRFALYRGFTTLYMTSPATRLFLVALVPLAWILLANIAPLAQMVQISFRNTYPLEPGKDAAFSFQHYAGFFEKPLYFRAFLRSFVFATLVTLATLLVVFPIAFYISKAAPKARRARLLLLVIAPFWVSEIIRSFAWIVMLANRGAVNALLGWIGLPGVPYELLYNNFSLSIGVIYLASLYMLLPLYSAIERIDDNLLEAAANLGASSWRRITRIILPLSMPGIVAGCTLVFLLTVGLFAMPVLLGGPGNTLFPAIIAQTFQKAGASWPQGSAYSILLTIAALGYVGLFIGLVGRRGRKGRS